MRKPITAFLILASALVVSIVFAASLRSSSRVTIRSSLSSSSGFSVARNIGDIDCLQSWESGTATGQCDVVYQAQYSISSAAPALIDLRGSLTDGIGGSAVFARVKSLYFRNLSAGSMRIGNGSNAWETWISGSGTITIPAYGQMLVTAPDTGWAVTAGTGDILQVVNLGDSVASFDISILGTSD